MNNTLEINNLTKIYKIGENRSAYRTIREELFRKRSRAGDSKTFKAIDDLTINVEEGNKVGIIGANGAGKSTLLKLISGITYPTIGHIKVNGRISSLLEVGTGFHPELTGRENIFLNGAILGMSKKEIIKNFDEIVEFSGVEKFLDTPVKRYSSGMYVKLAFSVAAHLTTDMLIVDEVLAVGDAAFQKKCLAKMDEISNERGTTLLFVSHNINTIKSLCNKGIYLESGKLKAYCDIDQACSMYVKDSFGIDGGAVWHCTNVDLEKPSIVSAKICGNGMIPFQGKISGELAVRSNNINFNIGIGIYDEVGNLIFTFHSNEVGAGLVDEGVPFSFCGERRISFDIDNTFLKPGTYYVNISLFCRELAVSYCSYEKVLSFTVGTQGENHSFCDYQQGVVVTRGIKWRMNE